MTPASLVAGACTTPISLARNSSSDGNCARTLMRPISSSSSPYAPPTTVNFSFFLAYSTQTFAAATGSAE